MQRSIQTTHNSLIRVRVSAGASFLKNVYFPTAMMLGWSKMTVVELINILKNFEPNEKIYCFTDRDGDGYIESSEVTGVKEIRNDWKERTEILIF